MRIVLVLLLAVVACGGAPAWAQDQSPDRVLLELQRTDDRIQQAEALLAANANVRAESEIAIARQRQGEARAAFDATRFALALDLTLGARVHADRAIAILRGLDLDRVRNQIDLTRLFIERAGDRLEECRNLRARAQLDLAETMLRRATDALDSGRPLAALQLALEARRHARQALQLCRVEDRLSDRVDRALQYTDEVLARAREVGHQEGVGAGRLALARRALSRGDELQQTAYRQFRAERFETALKLTQSARDAAHRALRLAGAAR